MRSPKETLSHLFRRPSVASEDHEAQPVSETALAIKFLQQETDKPNTVVFDGIEGVTNIDGKVVIFGETEPLIDTSKALGNTSVPEITESLKE